MEKIPLLLNASALRSSGACLLALIRTIHEGYHSPLRFNDTEYGNAVHKGIENFHHKGDEDEAALTAFTAYREAMKDPLFVERKDFLTTSHLSSTMGQYFLARKRGAFSHLRTLEGSVSGKLVERTFKIRYYEGTHVIVYLCGTIDELAEHTSGACYVLGDIKTTSFWKKEEYFGKFPLAPQGTFYLNAIHLMAEENPDSFYAKMVRRLGMQFMVMFLSKKEPTKCLVSDMIFRDDEQLAEFRKGLTRLCHRLDMHFSGTEPALREGMVNDACSGKFFPCLFYDVCKTSDEKTQKALLSRIPQKTYNPLMFRV